MRLLAGFGTMAFAAGETYRGVTNVVFDDVNPAFGILRGHVSWTPPSDMTDVDGYRFLITTSADGGIVEGGTPDLTRFRELEHPGLGGFLPRTYTNFTLADTRRQALISIPGITPPRYLQVYTIIDGQWQYASELAPSAIIPIYDSGGSFSTLPFETQHVVFADADPRCGYVGGGLSFVVPSDADFTYISSWRVYFAEDSMGTNPTSAVELPVALSNFINVSDYIGSRSVLIIAGATDTGDIRLPIAIDEACNNTRITPSSSPGSPLPPLQRRHLGESNATIAAFPQVEWLLASGVAPPERPSQASAVDDGRFWVFGGAEHEGRATSDTTNDLWYFGSELQSSTTTITITTSLSSTTWVDAVAWFQVESGPAERYSHASAMEGGRFWVFGGTDHSGREKSDLWHYTVEGAWTLVDEGSGPSARWLHSAAAAAGRFWIFGGFQQLTFSVFGDLWYFEDQAWTEVALGSGPSPRFGHVSAMALNRFWVFGGNDFRVEGLNDLWYFTPDVGWTSLPASGTWPSARQAGAAEADSSGRFWIFGGENAPFNAPFMRNDLWHFTVEANWTLVDAGSGFAPSVRAGCTSAMDAVGRFWLFGGHNYFAVLDDLWYFAEAWIQADSPGLWPPARFVHSSAMDASGRFWLFGGYNGTSGSCCTMNDLWYFGSEIQSSTTTTSQTTTTSSVSSTTTTSSISLSTTTETAVAAWFQAGGSGSGPSGRSSHSAASEGSRFWVFGGLDQSGGDKSDLWHYTPEAAWTLVDEGSGPSARYLHSAAADEGRLWIFGGRDGSSVFGDLWYFEDQVWSEVAVGAGPEPSPRFAHFSAMSLNRFWLFAGQNSAADFLDDLWYFTPDVGWRSEERLGLWPPARQTGAAAADSSGRFWIFGGFRGAEFYNDLWHFTVEANWTLVDEGSGSGPSGRAGCSAAMDAAGRFWLFGGFTGNGERLDDLWYFAEAWQKVGSSGLWPPARFAHSSAMDASARFWLFGGRADGPGTVRTNDLWYFGPEARLLASREPKKMILKMFRAS
ncbi:GPA3 [Symbiodinium microadriaticum]|nr:GPA3 [Symbiodinium microadriaticum]